MPCMISMAIKQEFLWKEYNKTSTDHGSRKVILIDESRNHSVMKTCHAHFAGGKIGRGQVFYKDTFGDESVAIKNYGGGHMVNLKDLQLEEMEKLAVEMGEARFRGKQLFEWIYRNVTSFEEMGNLPQSFRQKLKDISHLGLLEVRKVQTSHIDGTKKFLFGLKDGNAIESVFMKYQYGNSVCISSQVGCRMKCAFCASGLYGLKRNLTAGEMIDQILAAERVTGEMVNHVVVMGTGEPFDNYENLAAFLRIIHAKRGKNLSFRNITVSTCGIIPGIRRFAEEFPQVNLAISLHSGDNSQRSRMMPINQAYPLKELIQACRAYCDRTSRRITFEYTLVRGLNDGLKEAKELAELLRGTLCHVNLIPLNQVEETGLTPTTRKDAEAFRDYLETHGIPTTIRRELGDDISGACGQLRLEEETKKILL